MKENKLKTGTTLSTNTNDELSYTYLLSTEKRANSLIYENYNKVATSYNLLVLDNILSNGKYHIVALFKEFLIIDDNSEFLKRYYKKKESLPRIKKVSKYYYETSVIFPNYTPLFEAKFIYKNIMKKQKVIDQIQELENKKDKNIKRKDKDKNYLKEKVFNDTAYNEILNQSESVLRIVFGLKKENDKLNIVNSDDEEKNDKINDIQNLIDEITKYENNKPEILLNNSNKAKLKLGIPNIRNKPKLSMQNFQNGNLKTIMDYKNKTNILQTTSLRTFSPNSTNYNTINNSTSRNLKKNMILLSNNSINSNRQYYHNSTLSMPKINVSSSKEKKIKLLSINNIDNNNIHDCNNKNYFKNVNISNIKSPPDIKKTHKKIKSVLGTNNGIDILKSLNINFNISNTIDREKKILNIKQNNINKRRIKPSIILHDMGFFSERNKK